MCDMCDSFEAGDNENEGMERCPECFTSWVSCFNCGANSIDVSDCPYCCEDCEEEDLDNG